MKFGTYMPLVPVSYLVYHPKLPTPFISIRLPQQLCCTYNRNISRQAHTIYSQNHSVVPHIMKYTTTLLALAITAMALPTPRRPNQGGAPPAQAPPASATSSSATSITSKAPVIPESLVFAFGASAGIVSPNQPGSCLAPNGKNIPCNCPPDHGAFTAQLNKFQAAGNVFGEPFNYPTDPNDQSVATQLVRLNLCIIGLQNFDDTAKGVGCPAISAPNFTTLRAQLQGTA